MSSHPKPTDKPAGQIMPILFGTVFVAVLTAGAFGASWSAGNSLKAAASAAPPAASSPAPAEAAPAPAPVAVAADDLKALKEQVHGLTESLSALTAKVDGLPKPEPAPDLKPIQAKLDDLGGLAGKIDELAKKVDAADGQAQAAAKAADASKDEIAALKTKLDKPAETPAPKPAESKLVDLGPTAALLTAKKFADARAALAKLQQSNPDDARVWYYSALASGFASGKWDGETEQLVLKGVEREKAGTPDAAQIDATFSGLTTATGKTWLDSYRQRTKR